VYDSTLNIIEKHFPFDQMKKRPECIVKKHGSKPFCTSWTCLYCHDRSFASHTKSINWVYTQENGFPRMCSKSSHKKHLFQCENALHPPFSIRLYSVTNQEQWCNLCANHVADSIYQKLILSGLKIIPEQVFDWTMVKTCPMSFDFYLPEIDLLIEMDDATHFGHDQHTIDVRQRDFKKINLSFDNNLTIIHVVQKLFLNGRIDIMPYLVKRTAPSIIYLPSYIDYYKVFDYPAPI
jgi:hypothetical protein